MNSRFWEKLIFFLLIFLLPTQLGKHFWFPFSFVSGIQIDYLSPTIYITDILIITLLMVVLLRFLKEILKGKLHLHNRLKNHGIILFAVGILIVNGGIGAISSKSLYVSFYGIIKMLEMIFFGLYVWKSNYSFRSIAFFFIAGVSLQACLALMQIVNQGSINGVFYFLGERTFTSATPGIALASISGQLFLRPYATLPHPNVLAGYLLIAVECIVFIKTEDNKRYLSLLFAFLSFALFFTLSRVAVGAWFVLVVDYVLTVRKKTILLLAVFLISLVLFATPLFQRFVQTSFSEEAVINRILLINASLQMIESSPVFGVGALQFIPMLPSFFPNFFYSNLQPVHNIFLLIFAETGAIGIGLVLWFLIKTFIFIMKQKRMYWRLLVFGTILLLGLFDHYVITLQQGQLLCALMLGVIWRKTL